MLDYYSTADEIQDSGIDTALLPVGSVEQHGPHLPIATDLMIASAVGKKVSERLNVLLLPTLPVSTCREHMGKKGSVWINPDTFYYMIRDIVLSLKEQGFKRVILLIAHGGIFIANPAVRELNATNNDIKVIKVDLVGFMGSKEMAVILDCEDNLHAGELETSIILYLDKELVKKKKNVDSIPGVPRDYLNYGSIFKYSENGVWGKPSLASCEKGEKIFGLLVDMSINYVKKINELI